MLILTVPILVSIPMWLGATIALFFGLGFIYTVLWWVFDDGIILRNPIRFFFGLGSLPASSFMFWIAAKMCGLL
jgi:hypothetical protein